MIVAIVPQALRSVAGIFGLTDEGRTSHTQLLSWMENAGLKDVSWRLCSPVNGVAMGFKPFDEEAIYAVVTNNFCAAGGDTYNVFNRAYEEGFGFDTGIPMDEAVMDYITEVLGGVIGEAYAEPSPLATQVRP